MQIVAAAIKQRHDMETDMGKVRAASEAFYAALNARDPSAWQRCGLIPHMLRTSAR
jgi:hypothetical protein